MLPGIDNLKKEAGMTSHEPVFKLRKTLKEQKILIYFFKTVNKIRYSKFKN